MEKVTSGLENVSIRDVPYTKKMGGGTRGDKVEIRTNLSKISIEKNIPFYKYDVRMYVVYERNEKTVLKELTKQCRDDFPEQERKTATVQIWKKLLEHENAFFGQKPSFYDRAAVFFSLKKLELQQGEEKVFNLAKDVIPNYDDALGFKVVIKCCAESFQVSSNDIAKVCNDRASQGDRTILEVLGIGLSQKAFMDTEMFVTYGSGTHYLIDPMDAGFRQSELPNLPDGKYLGVGAKKSVKVLEGGPKENAAPYVAIDVTKTAFHADYQPLIEKLQCMSLCMDARDNFSVEMANRNKMALRDQLKGLYVDTLYGKKRNYRIEGLSEPANKKTFPLDNGKETTVAAYFQQKYNMKLSYPGLFVVTVSHKGKPISIPAEALCVAPSQRVTKTQQTPDENAICIKASATLPADRLGQIEKMKTALGMNNANRQLGEAGIKVADGPVTVPGRILPAPALQMGNKKIIRPLNNCSWKPGDAKFFNPVPLIKWMVVGQFLPNDRRSFDFDGFIDRLIKHMKSAGMTVNAPEKKIVDRPSEATVQSVLAEAKEKGLQLIFFITSNSLKLHKFMKMTEVGTQVVTQEVCVSTCKNVLEKRQTETLDNIIMKTNEKLGGLTSFVISNDPKIQEWISSPTTTRLFIGFEMSHPAPLSKAEQERGVEYRMPSVLGYAANSAANPQNFIGDYYYVKARQTDSMGSKLRWLIPRILREARANRGNRAPTHLVFYFNGVSQGQWQMILNDYLSSIRAGIADLSPGYKPCITTLAVTKQHTERLFNKNISGKKASEQNIPPGTCVDSVMVMPNVNEFFLTAHSAIQGTAKSPKFSLLSDDSGMSMDVIEGVTHALCYMHDIVNKTVSLPEPLMIAGECAKRGHNNWIASRSSTSDEMSLDQANAELTNSGKALGKVRYNA